MATLICNATGNFTGASTFAAAEAGALSIVLNRNTTTAIAAATTVTSTTFTVTNAAIIDGALLWMRATAASPTGTIKVDLQKSAVSQASVTINKTDLPDSTNATTCPVFFRFTGTATGDGNATWTIVITTTGTGTVTTSIASATTTNFTRALRTTTAATAASTNDIYITGELTGAGAHTSYTVTMDSTAATAYGNGSVNSTTVSGGLVTVSCYGTLSYGTSGSTAYILRVNGDLIVHQFGTLNIGSSGSEIPRTSTAVLEFQQASANGDFGLRCLDNSVVNIAGLSRTSAKNVVKCKLTSDMTSANLIASASNINISSAVTPLETSGTTAALSSYAVTDTVTNATHSLSFTATTVSNTTQTCSVWLARGTGTNNRFVRVTMGNNTTQSSVTNGFFSDIDLQAGTAGTVTAVGTGTATSVSIAASGTGYLVRMTGKVSSGSATTALLINVCSAAATLSFAGANNQALIVGVQAVVTASSIPDTTFNVDTDTGWLSGDAICVSGSSRTFSDGNPFPLNANAGASSMTSSTYLISGGNGAYTISGTAPTQTEVGLITRNVKVRSTTPLTFTSYVYCAALSTINFSWAEFCYFGVNTANRRGLEVDTGTTASAKSITYCSIHDVTVTSTAGLYLLGGNTSANLTLSNNVFWYNATPVLISAAITNADWTFDSNLIVRSITSGSAGFSLADIGGTCTNNIATGANNNYGFVLSESSAITGTFSGNVAHGNQLGGLNCSGNAQTVTQANFTAWRNGGVGINLSGTGGVGNFNGLTLFGNTTSNLSAVNACGVSITGTSTVAGDASFATTNGFMFNGAGPHVLNFAGIDASGTGTGLAVHTNDFNFAAGNAVVHGTANNCKFGGTNVISTTSKALWSGDSNSYIGLEKFNQTSGDHRCEMTYGTLKTDTSIFNSASPSMRMTPSSASFKLESAPIGKGILAAVASGSTINISVYARKSAVGDGAAYTGSQPRLIQRANAALGQTADVVLDTVSVGTGTWEQLTATSSTATDDGAWEFIVDCDGTAGWVNVDDWAAT